MKKPRPITLLDVQTLCRRGLLITVLLVSVTLIVFFVIIEFSESLALKDNAVKFTNTVKNTNFDQSEKVVSCYYNTPNNQNLTQLLPLDINPLLCTHINIAFAQVRNKVIFMEEYQYGTVLELVKLKKQNPNLKLLLSVGGSGNRDGFSDMVIDHASRKSFIKSIKYVLRNYSLDGVDLDWEFPGVRGNTEVGTNMLNYNKRERQHFSQLLREIRMEYYREKRHYLLTVAVAAQQIIVDAAYDVDQINMYVDYVNLMTYDYHYYTSFTPFTGLNSPLYPRPSEQLYMGTLNINYTVAMYLNKGLDASKIVLGIPTYGHTFTLVNENNRNIGSPASGYGALGNLGFVNYPEVCEFIQIHNMSINVDSNAKVPYVYKNSEWVSYDSPESVVEKAKFIKDNKLRGAMIYSLNADDYEGRCKHLQGNIRFPLTMFIKNTL
ncbi:chitotriosidase-1 [Aricia agestis]|uniref:chitotriosidase-1 n=1 Tax=Aricia agestis TaxID=91739 RepID=UPI001C208EEA|nr:chitotriosidase-1 [Aricia agestis]